MARIVDRFGPAICDAGKTDRIALLGRCGLETPIVGCTADDDAPDPLDDLLPFSVRQRIEVIGEMLGQPPALRRADIVQLVPSSRPPWVRQLRLKVSLW